MVGGSALWGLTLPSLVLVPALALGDLVDDFAGPHLDFNRWNAFLQEPVSDGFAQSPVYEEIREIDAAQGRLMLGVSVTGGEPFRMSELLANVAAAESMSGTLGLSEADAGDDGVVAVRISGVYYNADRDPAQDDASTAGDMTGDVFATLSLGDRGNGLEAWYLVQRWNASDLSSVTDVQAGTIIGPGELSFGEGYDAKIEYLGDNRFSFTLNAHNELVDDAPARQGKAAVPFQRFDAFAQPGQETASVLGWAAAANVNSTPHDTFDQARIDPDRWFHSPEDGIFLSRVRAVQDGRLRLDVQGEGLFEGMGDRHLESLRAATGGADHVQSEVEVSSASQMDPGILSRSLLIAVLYNHERDGGDQGLEYDGVEGDVWAQMWLEYSEGVLSAHALAAVLHADGTFSQFGYEQFAGLQLKADNAYLLSIMLDEQDIVFMVDGNAKVRLEIPPDHSIFPASPASLGGMLEVRNEVRGTGGGGGIARASFDNVRTSPVPATDPGNGNSDTDDGASSGGGGSSGGCSVVGHGGGAEVPFVAVLLMLLWWASRRVGRLW